VRWRAEVQRSLSLDIDLEPFYRWAGCRFTLAQLIARAMDAPAARTNVVRGPGNFDQWPSKSI